MGGIPRRDRIGAVIYNAAHATPLPTVLIGLGWWQHRPLVAALRIVWLARTASVGAVSDCPGLLTCHFKYQLSAPGRAADRCVEDRPSTSSGIGSGAR
jgi:Domain of unknown function (DUF4260)